MGTKFNELCDRYTYAYYVKRTSLQLGLTGLLIEASACKEKHQRYLVFALQFYGRHNSKRFLFFRVAW